MIDSDLRAWDFDEYHWLDRYDERMRRRARLCYDATLGCLPDLAQARAGDSVLDIGTGTANSALPFLQRGCRVVGLDPSQRMLRQAREKAAHWHARLVVLRVRDPFLTIPFRDEAFDVVVAAYAIHHLDDDAKRHAVREMKRVLKPTGRIAIADTMFRDASHKAEALGEHADLEDEYQPMLSTFPPMFHGEGLHVVMHRVGELVWVLIAAKPRCTPLSARPAPSQTAL